MRKRITLIGRTGKRFSIADLTGLTVGKRTVLGLAPHRNGRTYWIVRCQCGREQVVSAKRLQSKRNASLSCIRCSPKRSLELAGQRFGLLTAIAKTKQRTNQGHNLFWRCLCDCGTLCEVVGSRLVSGDTRSCGCLARKLSRERGLNATGKKNPNWNPNLTNEERVSARLSDDKAIQRLNKWRDKVYRRYGWSCDICGSNNKRLEAHHVYSWGTHTQLRFVAANGVCLCTVCHVAFHKEYGYGNNTRRQYTAFKKKRKL